MKKSSPRRDYRDFLADIEYSARQAEKFVEGFNFEDFSQDEKTKYAVIRALEIIGEATKNVPQKFKSEHKEIPWKDLADFRNELIHEYFGVNAKVLWRVLKSDVPIIKDKMAKLLNELKINRLI
jgi:uncharacterized protein with HEPN domain